MPRPNSHRYIASPPQSALRHACNAESLQALEPGAVRAQEWPRHGSPKLPRGALRAALRAYPESDDELWCS
eukprot:11855222-Alexandrium_andersonii.AAC.1